MHTVLLFCPSNTTLRICNFVMNQGGAGRVRGPCGDGGRRPRPVSRWRRSVVPGGVCRGHSHCHALQSDFHLTGNTQRTLFVGTYQL